MCALFIVIYYLCLYVVLFLQFVIWLLARHFNKLELNWIFLKGFIAQKIQRDTQGYKIVPLTNLLQLSFAEASDRVSTVLGMYIQCSSEKQVQREKHWGSNLIIIWTWIA
jgi:hypothetical protein